MEDAAVSEIVGSAELKSALVWCRVGAIVWRLRMRRWITETANLPG